MKDIVASVQAWAHEGRGVAVATVVSVLRSAPRPLGAKMAVNDRGELVGAVSGGCVEGSLIEAAETILAGDPPRLYEFGLTDEDAWGIGLPCGGEISVFVERYEPSTAHARFAAIAAADGRAALVTVVGARDEAQVGAKLFVHHDGGVEGTLGSAELDAAAQLEAQERMWTERPGVWSLPGVSLFVDVTAPAPRLVIFGAVDIAQALCRIADAIGWRSYVVDPRSRFAAPERFPEAAAVVAAWPGEAFARIGGIDRGTSVAVLTHDPKLDDAALLLALESDARYIGAMGSRAAQESRRRRLLEAGVSEAALRRISAPIGLDLGAASAQETALSMLSEAVALRNGRSGGRLSAAEGRIHDLVA